MLSVKATPTFETTPIDDSAATSTSQPNSNHSTRRRKLANTQATNSTPFLSSSVEPLPTRRISLPTTAPYRTHSNTRSHSTTVLPFLSPSLDEWIKTHLCFKPPLYSEAFQEIANRYKVIIGLREPNTSCQPWLMRGYPTKNFHNKAKTASTGPAAGLVCEKAEYSKVLPDGLESQKKAINSAIKKGAQRMSLILHAEHLDFLLSRQLITVERALENGDLIVSCDFPSNVKGSFIIKSNGQVLEEKTLEPVIVLGNPKAESKSMFLPVTADYDLFAIYPRSSQSINPRALNVPPSSTTKSSKLKETLAQLFPIQEKSDDEDEDMGNIHPFGKTIIKALNKATQQSSNPYTGGQLVWHNDETGNPFSHGFRKEDRPIFFIPGSNEPVQIFSLKELIQLQQLAREAGYSPEYSAQFGF